MTEVTVRDLRNHGGEILDRVESGESLTVTRDGRPVAELGPVSGSRTVATLQTLRALGAADDAWLSDQQRLRDEDRELASDPWA